MVEGLADGSEAGLAHLSHDQLDIIHIRALEAFSFLHVIVKISIQVGFHADSTREWAARENEPNFRYVLGST